MSTNIGVLSTARPDPVESPEFGASLPVPIRLLSPPSVSTEGTDFIRFYSAPVRGALWRPLLIFLLVVAATGGGLWSILSSGSPSGRPARVAVTTSKSGFEIRLTGGLIDLAQLRTALTRSGHGNLISPLPGGAVAVNADIYVGKRATLTVTSSALLLRSGLKTHVRLSTDGGALNFDDDTITSWTSQRNVDADPVGGRADIVATGHGAQLNFTHCQVLGLGTDAGSPGVSWREGAAGTVLDSQFSENWRGAYAYKAGPLTILGSSFTGSQEDGLLLLDSGAGSTIQNSNFANNDHSGLEIAGTRGSLTLIGITAHGNRLAGLLTRVDADVAVSDGLFYSNNQFGISADGGRLSLVGTKVWANTTGITVDGGVAAVTGSDLSGNSRDGMYVTGSGSRVTASADRFDHNTRSGVWVTDGRVAVTDGLFDENVTGIRVDGFSDSFEAEDNTITNSVKDGVALEVAPGIEIRGNVIEGNGDSAISTNKAYNLTRVLRENTIADNHTATRIRGN